MVHLGDITQVEVDAVVNSENSDLIMDVPGGPSVSGAIRNAEGEQIARQVARLGPIEPGRCVLTPAANMPCKWIVHAASVIKTEEGHHTTLTIIREAVRSALQLAAGLGLASIAFPAFGVRATNITRKQASQAMVEELLAGLRHQTSVRRVVIALLDPESFLAFFEEAIRRGTQANEPLVLRVDLDREELEFAFQETTGPVAQEGSTPFSPQTLREILDQVARLRSAVERRLLDQSGELQALGARVHGLLPGFVVDRLRTEKERPLWLRIDEELAGLPFELAWDGERYLAEQLQVSRLLVTRSQSRATRRPGRESGRWAPSWRLEALLLAGGLGRLPGAAREAEFLLDLLWRRAQERSRVTLLADRRATRRAVLDLLPKVELLHWCGHTETREGKPCWTLAEDAGLAPADLASLQLKARLVVANSCGPEGGVEMALAFLMAGARNYVGTLWDVHDDVARAFALHLYEELCLGQTVGEAVAAARGHLRRADAIHWAAYVHYGDPRERLFESVAL